MVVVKAALLITALTLVIAMAMAVKDSGCDGSWDEADLRQNPLPNLPEAGDIDLIQR